MNHSYQKAYEYALASINHFFFFFHFTDARRGITMEMLQEWYRNQNMVLQSIFDKHSSFNYKKIIKNTASLMVKSMESPDADLNEYVLEGMQSLLNQTYPKLVLQDLFVGYKLWKIPIDKMITRHPPKSTRKGIDPKDVKLTFDDSWYVFQRVLYFNKLSFAQLAKILNIPRQAVRDITIGKQRPKARDIILMCGLYGIDLADWISNTPQIAEIIASYEYCGIRSFSALVDELSQHRGFDTNLLSNNIKA